MRRLLPFAAVLLLLAGLLPAAPASAASPSPEAAAAAYRSKVLAYWTPERMKAAKPRDLSFDPVRGFKLDPSPTAGRGGSGGSGGSGGGSTSVPNSSGASYTYAGAALTGTGRVYFELNGSGWICSASVLSDTDTSRSYLLTAGHCTMDAGGAWATRWIFIPEFDTNPTYTCANTTHGCWVASALYGDNGFKSASGFGAAIPYDYAIAVVGVGGKSGDAQLDTTVGGGFALAPTSLDSQTVGLYGYPAEGKYTGLDLTYCQGSAFTDPYNSSAFGVKCSMNGGASGGPWLKGDARTFSATAVGANSYRYTTGGLNNLYSAKFTSRTSDVFTAAKAGSASGNVVTTSF